MSTKCLRPIAIYLPQFHPIPENDEWWGKGFTEWTNVAKAKPLFHGHHQPKLPSDLGFYDLRVAEVREEQAALAKEYNIYGFCYYHYWFNGRQVLERPIKEILKSGKPDFPFMLCWANENWTRVWDGGEKNVLLEQKYSPDDDVNHIKHLIPYFKDPRYIRIDNKPVFAIYRSSNLPDPAATVKTWREEAKKEGIELYLVRFESMNETGEKHLLPGFDAGVEFQPHLGMKNPYVPQKSLRNEINKETLKRAYLRRKNIFKKWAGTFKSPDGEVYEYKDFVERELLALQKFKPSYKLFRNVCPAFDNTSRKAKNYVVLKNSTPDLFQKWLQAEVDAFEPYSKEENIFFINAWNEWAEGNYLEPDKKWERKYLEAVKNVFSP